MKPRPEHDGILNCSPITMNPTPRSPRAAKADLPKARVMRCYRDYENRITSVHEPVKGGQPGIPVSVIPNRNAAEARAFVAFWRLGEGEGGERVERVAKAIHEANLRSSGSWGTISIEEQVKTGWRECADQARAVLALFAKPATQPRRSHE